MLSTIKYIQDQFMPFKNHSEWIFFKLRLAQNDRRAGLYQSPNKDDPLRVIFKNHELALYAVIWSQLDNPYKLAYFDYVIVKMSRYITTRTGGAKASSYQIGQ